jgi:hypothetical protein
MSQWGPLMEETLSRVAVQQDNVAFGKHGQHGAAIEWVRLLLPIIPAAIRMLPSK